ncbi:CHAT domain-containing protein [Lusitaniella coriacea LEGE 07157]|uniref:CHAT domain-containing protein n=1 Tax=Lusitaniella coriacea LEGE 07157 TaxID=945747 RepID=A0A8J7DSQ3_9CYAN|nr:CHAT domain-containing tetratricopeptide repeat protein [Lusitaniella coriacea]MBE9114547.1 CHAT domain-containing protein [Lusitaniella coriacea LEGE 07157]
MIQNRVKQALIGIFTLGLGTIPVAATTVPRRTLSVPSPTPTENEPQQPADALFQKGIEQAQQNQLEAAIASWEEALKLYQQQKNPQGEALTLEQLGLAYQRMGESDRALEFYQQQRAIARTLEDRHGEARGWGNIASTNRALGNYSAAIDANEKALNLLVELEDRRGEGQVLGNLGNVYIALGEYDKAAELHEKSLAIAQEMGNQQGAVLSLNSLGAIAASAGDYEKATDFYQKSLEAAKTINFIAAEADALNNLGSIHHALKEYDRAIDYYQQTLEIAETMGSLRLKSAALASLGLAHASKQDYSQALDYQAQSWQMAKEMGDRPLESIALGNWGHTLWKAGELEEAEEKLNRAIEIRESLRANLEDAQKVSIFDTQIRAYYLLQQILVAQNRPEAALEIAERGRSRAFVELLAKRISSESAAESIFAKPPNIEKIRQIAKDHQATLVEYSIIPDDRFIAQGKLVGSDLKLFIWVVQPNGTITFRNVDLNTFQFSTEQEGENDSPEEGIQIKKQVRDLRRVLFTPRRARTRKKLQELHQLLIQPITDLLPTNPEDRVIFIPQGSLFVLPFPALQDENKTYLIDKHTLLTSPSIQVLDLTHQQKAKLAQTKEEISGDNALIVGNPTMPDKPPGLLPLKGAEEEAIEIAKMLDAQALIGEAATETAVVEKMPDAKLIHLATHGLLNEIVDLGLGAPGAIALAPTPGVTDGLLTTEEILNLQLNAELVVLSACNTGQGDITGDGVIGLSRALVTAGVPSVLVSLWAVPDAPTAELMTEFYRQLAQNPDKAQALRQAMLKTKEEFPPPSNWAAFTPIGEP